MMWEVPESHLALAPDTAQPKTEPERVAEWPPTERVSRVPGMLNSALC